MLNHCGKKVNIEKNAVFSSKVSLGDYSGIGVNAKISGACKIGKYVMMAPNCTIYSRNHEFSDTEKPMMFQGYKETQPVEIGDDVWISGNVTILPGVKDRQSLDYRCVCCCNKRCTGVCYCGR